MDYKWLHNIVVSLWTLAKSVAFSILRRELSYPSYHFLIIFQGVKGSLRCNQTIQNFAFSFYHHFPFFFFIFLWKFPGVHFDRASGCLQGKKYLWIIGVIKSPFEGHLRSHARIRWSHNDWKRSDDIPVINQSGGNDLFYDWLLLYIFFE